MEFEKGQIIVIPVTHENGKTQNRYFHVQSPHEVLPIVAGYIVAPMNGAK